MDILSKKVLSVGSVCYLIRASVEESFIYIRFKGEITEMYSNKDLIMYRIKITDILEYDKEFINTYLNRKSFRCLNSENGRTFNILFYVYDIINSSTFIKDFTGRYSKYLLDVHSSMVFETEKEMQTAYVDTVKYLQNKINSIGSVLKDQLKNK